MNFTLLIEQFKDETEIHLDDFLNELNWMKCKGFDIIWEKTFSINLLNIYWFSSRENIHI